MNVITQTQERTITTPAAVMVGLAAPSQGTSELSTWLIRMAPDGASPVHIIDREQVWMPLSGTFEFTIGDETVKVGPGEALAVPAESVRQFRAGAEAAEALVCMAAGGQAGVPGSDAKQQLPWAV